ncbi:helix-turn-helix transcriptional regulator [Mycolicibacterium celeriflavum]|uniref:ArsR family transcriptional regulator n=1 Tax=Mycolicibacterium celeriflavum TaxID=1249101 RepID=A0A1X0BRY5_MYCCF|nr:helix-turn-helix domain-containing protein [Mycolicibacterium celeriflavum]MCV7237351.1 helix-turn-helix domain-containing protein [Mycolicibacterium celeriflavum]ORA45980.1 ArsR family transcriptional regulator [Mycolicibacterium celeriflavum]BBY46018.1 ArsR family transcriptional regulator [Mycolicibacterium celeriflavum]
MARRFADPASLTALNSLDDPLRRRLHDYVVEHGAPVSRDAAAAAVGIGRTLAAYHLDKLADAGLLDVSYERPPGRGGPGAGRPAKLYTGTADEIVVSVPPRDYLLLARLLVSSIEQDAGGAVRSALTRAARDTGRRAAVDAEGDVMEALRDCGYLPQADADGCVTLRNCPFHSVAKDHLEVVCGLNLQLVEGVIEGSSSPGARAELSPREGRCCVLVRGASRQGAADD